MPFSSESHPNQVDSSTDLNVGDVLLRQKTAVMHIGVYVGDNMVFDNAPGRGESLVEFEHFSKNNPVYAIPTHLPAEVVQKKVKEILRNPKKYHLFRQNCEHSARHLLGGPYAVSMQLREVEEWALIGAALGKGLGRKGMWAGALIGATAGTLSLSGMRWLKRKPHS